MSFLLRPMLPLLLISLSIGAPCTDAWGWQGHQMICEIAEGCLTEMATRAVWNLLGGGRLADSCNWADEVKDKPQYSWSKPLHHANTKDVCNYDHARDCPDDECVVGAIERFERELRTYPPKPDNTYNLRESLMFLAHFMGDVHQPLHVGFKRDAGGTLIHVTYPWPRRRAASTLHDVWDADMVQDALSSFYGYSLNQQAAMIRSIEMKMEGELVITAADSAAKYASESIELACYYAYRDERDGILHPGLTHHLRRKYFCSRSSVVEKRIGEAGARLAALLNQIFGSLDEPN